MATQQYGEVVWVTREGDPLTMNEIENNHLLNIIRHLKKRYLHMMSEGYSALSCLQGEMASYYAEQELDHGLQDMQDKISFFEQEAKRRGILK
jgi:hypothetical protein